MKLSTILLLTGILSIVASIYFIIHDKYWDTILPGLLCGVSLTYFGAIEHKKENRNENEQTKKRK